MRRDLNELAAASREALMAEWREVVGRPPPKHLSRPLMVQILSYAYQLETVGGYTKRLDGRLKNAARRDVVRPAFKQPKHTIWRFSKFVTQDVGAAPLPCKPQQTARVSKLSSFL
jgi:hypothetical protein